MEEAAENERARERSASDRNGIDQPKEENIRLELQPPTHLLLGAPPTDPPVVQQLLPHQQAKSYTPPYRPSPTHHPLPQAKSYTPPSNFRRSPTDGPVVQQLLSHRPLGATPHRLVSNAAFTTLDRTNPRVLSHTVPLSLPPTSSSAASSAASSIHSSQSSVYEF